MPIWLKACFHTKCLFISASRGFIIVSNVSIVSIFFLIKKGGSLRAGHGANWPAVNETC